MRSCQSIYENILASQRRWPKYCSAKMDENHFISL